MAKEEGTVDPVDPIVDQGKQAKELKLTAADCPYAAQGDNRANWFKGFGAADPEAAAAE